MCLCLVCIVISQSRIDYLTLLPQAEHAIRDSLPSSPVSTQGCQFHPQHWSHLVCSAAAAGPPHGRSRPLASFLPPATPMSQPVVRLCAAHSQSSNCLGTASAPSPPPPNFLPQPQAALQIVQLSCLLLERLPCCCRRSASGKALAPSLVSATSSTHHLLISQYLRLHANLLVVGAGLPQGRHQPPPTWCQPPAAPASCAPPS